MKIVVTGFSGSGKTTLSDNLAEILSIPVLHLDNVHFLPNWKVRSDEEMDKSIIKFMDDNPSWVIDGNYLGHVQDRFEKADLIIFMNFPRFSCLKRVLKRIKENRDNKKCIQAEGCVDRYSPSFLFWVYFSGRTKKRKKQYKKIFSNYENKLKILQNDEETLSFLEEVKNEKSER